MLSVSRLELIDRLGYRKDPFKSKRFKTGDSSRIQRLIDLAIKNRAMVSIVGERGAGKTETVNDCIKNSAPHKNLWVNFGMGSFPKP